MKSSRKKERILLPGGCSMSAPSISPANWKQVSASCKKDWYIFYRFYDPVNRPKGLPKIVKGMNDYKTAPERRAATERALEDELALLRGGYNPATRSWAATEAGELTEYTPLVKALQTAAQLITCAEATKNDIRGMLHWIPIAITKARLDNLSVGEVKERHVLQILDRCSQIKSRWDWSVHKHNKYRSYLMILFKRIKKAGAIETNPCTDIEKERSKELKAKRTTLTPAERSLVDQHLRKTQYPFWRLLHIFFHSGARESEIMLVKGKDVDLEHQYFTRIVKKGSRFREVSTPIKDIALPYWTEAMATCGPDDFVFGRKFLPGPVGMKARHISRTWQRKVKVPLGIDADFYSLKHSNSTETAAIAGEQAAAEQNGHPTTAMVRSIYDTKREEREHARLKKVNNPFA
jgi:integrase